ARTRLAKSTHDAGWAQFLGILERKAVEAGARLVPVDPRFTSQKCSRCGAMPEMRLTLADRVHRCGGCGQVLDRDLNAARNIFAAAFG
ncbi:MAG: transposase, partial [Cytophagaceae bacterium]